MVYFEKQYKDLCQQIDAVKESSDSSLQSTVQIIENNLDIYIRKIFPCIGAIKEKANYFSHYELEKPEEYQLMTIDLMYNQEVLQKRRKELEQIHKTAPILKDTTGQMAMELKDLDSPIDENETNVITSKKKAEKAKQEITNPDEISIGNKKKCVVLFS